METRARSWQVWRAAEARVVRVHALWRHVTALLAGLLCLASLTLVVPGYAAASAPPGEVYQTFNYTGATQTWLVPSGVTSVEVEAWGAQGGNNGAISGGLGGIEFAVVPVTPGETLNVDVGGAGPNVGSGTAGGWNGGGSGVAESQTSQGAAAGGGASDVRSGSTMLAVAGGGGGAGGDSWWCGALNSPCGSPSAYGGAGGAGGAATGGSGLAGQAAPASPGGNVGGGGGGGVTNADGTGSGGAGGSALHPGNNPGSLGVGGNGYGSCDYSGDGAGGGGGYYGGGGGGSGCSGAGGGGGGGSGEAQSGANAIGAGGVNKGNGVVIIASPPTDGVLAFPPGVAAVGEGTGQFDVRHDSTCNNGPSPINCASGDFWHNFTDVSVPGRGAGLDLSRTYNAPSASTKGIFGYGWSSSYDMHLVTNSDGSVTITEEDGSQVNATPNGSGGYAFPAWADSMLTKNSDGTWTFVRHQTTTFVFDSTGKLVSIADLNGYQTTLSYNTSGQLTTATDAAGRTIGFSFGSNGLVSQVTDPANQVTSYSYDTSGDLIDVTDPMTRKWSFGYDPSGDHLLTTMTDPDNGTTTNVYDSAGRVTKQTDPAGLSTTYSYSGSNFSPGGGTTTITDAHGNVETQNYQNGQLVSLTKGAGTPSASTWDYSYDQSSLAKTSVTDPDNHTVQSIYDQYGNLLSVTDALGNTTSYTYNSFDEPLTVTDPVGIETSYSYDSKGNVATKTVTGVGGSPVLNTTYTYGDANPGDLTQMTDPAGQITSYTYDSYGDVSSTSTHPTSTTSDTTRVVYDVLGRRVCEASPNATASGVTCPAAGQPRVSDTTTYSYDPDSEITSETYPDGNTTNYSYNSDGNQTQITDPTGDVTETVYDADNRKSSVTAGHGTSAAATTSYAYDIPPGTGSCSGSVTGATDCTTTTSPAGQVSVDYFDAQNRQIQETLPATGATSSTYDPAGNLLTKATSAGETAYGYDPDNQLTSVTYSNPTSGFTTAPNVTYSYDADGNRTRMTDGTGTTSYAYDSLERLTSSTNGAGSTVTYGHDPDGHTTTITYPGSHTVTYAFDKAGNPTSVTDWQGNVTNYNYDADSNRITQTTPTAGPGTPVVDSYSYDNTDQLTSTNTTQASTTLASFRYARNSDALVSSVTSTGVPADNHSYGYDSLNRLTVVDSNNSAYTYNTDSDPTTMLSGQTQSFNAADQLTGITYGLTTGTDSYNSAGDRTAATSSIGTSAAYSYDQTNRLTAVSTSKPQNWAKSVASGADHETAVKSDGTVWDWGYNTSGQLGDGSTASSSTPVQVSGLTGITEVADGFNHSIALKSDGTVWAWGYNAYGELGDGTNTNSSTPVQVSGLTGVVAIAAGGDDTLALKSDGTVWAWGANPYGELGNGNTTDSNTPVEVSGLTGVSAIAISTGYGFATALKSDGTVWAWGYNYDGELGDGTTNQSLVPVQVSNLTGVTAITTGSRHTLALKSDGTVWSWGYNAFGQLGDGTNSGPQSCGGYACSTTPVQVTNLSGVTAIATGQYYSSAVTSGGDVWSWGTNGYGELGNGSDSDSSLPVQAAGLTGVIAIAGGYATTIAEKNDGTIWAWGYNADGELGNGTTTNSDTPVQADFTSAMQPSAESQTNATYTYNGDNLRMTKTVNGTTTAFVYDTNSATPSVLSDGTNNYIYGPGGLPLEMITTSGTVYWYHHDQLGSTRLITNDTGAIVATYTYNPYGNVTASTGNINNPLQFAGAYTDSETGLEYLINRYYDPATGGFLSADPAVGITGQPYNYTSGDPVNATDPTGLWDAGACENGDQYYFRGCAGVLVNDVDLAPDSSVVVCGNNPSNPTCSHAGALGVGGTVLDDLSLGAGLLSVATGTGELAAGAAGVDDLFGVGTETLGRVSNYSGITSFLADVPRCALHRSVEHCGGAVLGGFGVIAGFAGGDEVDWELGPSGSQGLAKSLALAGGMGALAWDGLDRLAQGVLCPSGG